MAEQNQQKKDGPIPTTGRIGRFIKIVKEYAGKEGFMKVAQGSPGYHTMSDAQKALWWKGAIERMEVVLGRETSLEVMAACGAKCCGAGHRKTARRLMEESSSVEDFLCRLEKLGKNEDDLRYSLIDDKKIMARHNKCFCGQVKNSPEMHKSDLYCNCSVEFNRRFFSAAFDGPVEVKLKKSILMGDGHCEFEIEICK